MGNGRNGPSGPIVRNPAEKMDQDLDLEAAITLHLLMEEWSVQD